eukprot:CAMPEP_0183340180 /NCGR_PEP_ID=MMETSP0164_2-20130417/6823_1 /TAXON_ID=221442 /ORGANISM="Coccolithus pelagicus ssp braarudi, Strain PLY182g" /LENGTH=504 /DNA_ID=CAMNT_0025510281 /DNA_START=87 /DNA_END=1601 /DNA_ORIENTATION=-
MADSLGRASCWKRARAGSVSLSAFLKSKRRSPLHEESGRKPVEPPSGGDGESAERTRTEILTACQCMSSDSQLSRASTRAQEHATARPRLGLAAAAAPPTPARQNTRKNAEARRLSASGSLTSYLWRSGTRRSRSGKVPMDSTSSESLPSELPPPRLRPARRLPGMTPDGNDLAASPGHSEAEKSISGMSYTSRSSLWSMNSRSFERIMAHRNRTSKSGDSINEPSAASRSINTLDGYSRTSSFRTNSFTRTGSFTRTSSIARGPPAQSPSSSFNGNPPVQVPRLSFDFKNASSAYSDVGSTPDGYSRTSSFRTTSFTRTGSIGLADSNSFERNVSFARTGDTVSTATRFGRVPSPHMRTAQPLGAPKLSAQRSSSGRGGGGSSTGFRINLGGLSGGGSPSAHPPSNAGHTPRLRSSCRIGPKTDNFLDHESRGLPRDTREAVGGVGGGGGEGRGEGRSVQERLEDALGKDVFKTFVVTTGVLCYPLMAYGIAMKLAEKGVGGP